MVENMFVDEKQTKTAKEHYELTEHQVEEVSNILLLETSGHPRSLTDAFQSCRTCEQISSYTVYDRPGDDIDWRRFLENFRYFQKPLQVMMNSVMAKQEINLAVRWKDEEEKGFLYDAIAEGFRILWDGTIDKATLFMPRYLQQMIISTVYPLNELLEKVVPAIINIPMDYPDVLELLFLTRFQELCQVRSCLEENLPTFFDNQQLSSLKGVEFSRCTYWMPKGTAEGSRTTSNTTNLDTLMAAIFRLREPLNLKPHSKAESPDIVMMTTVQDKTLLLGLAVKNYSTVQTIEDACKKMDRLCSLSDGN